MRVLVTGGTGFIGGRLIPELLERGHEVVALVRDAEAYDRPDGVQVIEGDLLKPETLAPAFEVDGEPVDAAYYLVHSMDGGAGYAERDRTCARHFAAAATDAGVDRVIYLGGLGDDDDELSEHLRSRREVERLLADGDYDLTTLRSGVIVGAGGAGFEVIRGLAARLPVMVTPRWVDTPCQPIAIDDVVAYLAGVLDVPATAGNTYEIGGPEVMSYADALRRTRERLGKRLVIVRAPVLSPGLSAHWLRLFTDVDLDVARALVKGLQNPVVVTDDRIRDHLDVDLTPFDEAVDRVLHDSDGLESGAGSTR